VVWLLIIGVIYYVVSVRGRKADVESAPAAAGADEIIG